MATEYFPCLSSKSTSRGDLELSHAMENRGEKMDAFLKSRIFAGVVVGFFYRFKS